MRRADSPGKENLILTKIFLAFYLFLLQKYDELVQCPNFVELDAQFMMRGFYPLCCKIN